MNKKTFGGLVLAGLVALSLAGCVASPVAGSITKDQRIAFEKACNDVHGTFSGLQGWEVPTCTVIYRYPAFPDQGAK